MTNNIIVQLSDHEYIDYLIYFLRSKKIKHKILKISDKNEDPYVIISMSLKKRDFDKDPVLDRMEIQLKKSGIETEFVRNIDF